MLYAIIAEDTENSLERRLQARPAHLERVQKLADEGRVLIAGPLPAIDSEDPGPAGFTGSLLIVDFPSRQACEEWISGDPYVTEGVFRSVTVKPFKKVLP